MPSYVNEVSWCIAAVVAIGCGDNHRAAIDAAPVVPDAVALDAIVADAPVDAPAFGCGSAADCATGEVCTWAPQHACGLDQGRGACEPRAAHFCPSLAFWVCGCDGDTYFNECLSRAHGTDIAYGGPCRPTAELVSCTTSADCPPDDTVAVYCVDDPRDDCDPNQGGTGCAGVCVRANQTCSPTLPCLAEGSTSLVESPDTEACVAIANPDPAGDPAACVYTSRERCASAADCGGGELCLSDFACPQTSGCLGWCVRP